MPGPHRARRGRCGRRLLITADHGNAELKVDARDNSPLTAHTTSPVPVILCGTGAAALRGRRRTRRRRSDGAHRHGPGRPRGDDRPQPVLSWAAQALAAQSRWYCSSNEVATAGSAGMATSSSWLCCEAADRPVGAAEHHRRPVDDRRLGVQLLAAAPVQAHGHAVGAQGRRRRVAGPFAGVEEHSHRDAARLRGLHGGDHVRVGERVHGDVEAASAPADGPQHHREDLGTGKRRGHQHGAGRCAAAGPTSIRPQVTRSRVKTRPRLSTAGPRTSTSKSWLAYDAAPQLMPPTTATEPSTTSSLTWSIIRERTG